MDPFQHLILPLLFLLAMRIDTRRAVMFAPLAILPDFDSLFGLHRALGHSFVPVLVLPMIILLYAKYRKPEWLLSALIVQFYLASHGVLDMGGVAFLWPLVPEQFYFEPTITYSVDGGPIFGFQLAYGMRELQEMGTTSFLSDAGVALLFLGALMVAVFRMEARAALRTLWETILNALGRLFGWGRKGGT
ncbi:MAG: metal-dependent hydrolase [Methanobacteriota archaeon]|nr:MAG: metal-dependent hydrolase [Euryarchaeota archaeon]